MGKNNKPNVLDKYDCFYLTALAHIELKSGDKKKAEGCLNKAKKIALKFDAAPDYDVKNLNFMTGTQSLMLHDSLGSTCMEAIEKAMEYLKARELQKMWSKLK